MIFDDALYFKSFLINFRDKPEGGFGGRMEPRGGFSGRPRGRGGPRGRGTRGGGFGGGFGGKREFERHSGSDRTYVSVTFIIVSLISRLLVLLNF